MSRHASHGRLELGLAVDPSGRTSLLRRAQSFPLRLTVPLYLDPADPGMAFLYVQNPTGGVFAHDRLAVRLDVGPGGRAHLTTTAATKVYRMEDGRAAASIRASLAEDAYLEVVPEPIIPHAGARFDQELRATLAPGSCLLTAELVTPGRNARGELFAYESLSLRTAIADAGGRELCADTLSFEPGLRLPSRRGQLGRNPFFATLMAAAPGRDGKRLAHMLDDAVRAVPGTLAGADELPNGAGALARILASTGAAARQGLDAAWEAARRMLLGLPLPPRRK